MSSAWESTHKALGYQTEHEMFQDLYITQKMTLRELSGILGTGVNTVRTHLHAAGVPARPRGGKNRLGMSRVRSLPDSALEHPEKSAVDLGLHPSALYKEKRRRKEEKANASPSEPSTTVPGGDVVGK